MMFCPGRAKELPSVVHRPPGYVRTSFRQSVPGPIPFVVRCAHSVVPTWETRYVRPDLRNPTLQLLKFQPSSMYCEPPIDARRFTRKSLPSARSTCARVIPSLTLPMPTPGKIVDSVADALATTIAARTKTNALLRSISGPPILGAMTRPVRSELREPPERGPHAHLDDAPSRGSRTLRPIYEIDRLRSTLVRNEVLDGSPKAVRHRRADAVGVRVDEPAPRRAGADAGRRLLTRHGDGDLHDAIPREGDRPGGEVPGSSSEFELRPLTMYCLPSTCTTCACVMPSFTSPIPTPG